MKINYLILAHEKFEQLEKLVLLLRHDCVRFFIHIDAKIDLKEIRKFSFFSNPRVKIAKSRLDIKWGGFNMVKATINLLKDAAKEKENGYMILLSGLDLPLKSPQYIHDFLKRNYGNEYIEYQAIPTSNWGMNGGMDRIHYYWFIDKLRFEDYTYLYELQRREGKIRPYFKNLTPYGGSQWWCLTFECVRYILKFIELNKLYVKYYEHCYTPDEMFFHSIVLNSEFKLKVINNNLRYIDWKSGPQYPKILIENDFEHFFQIDKLWGRKFIYETDSIFIKQIEDLIAEM
jgi:hypothetical protein